MVAEASLVGVPRNTSAAAIRLAYRLADSRAAPAGSEAAASRDTATWGAALRAAAPVAAIFEEADGASVSAFTPGTLTRTATAPPTLTIPTMRRRHLLRLAATTIPTATGFPIRN